MIEIKKLNYSIKNKHILKDISFKFQQGKFYGIIGPNGSGKTTFLDLISGYKEHKNNYNEIYVFDKHLKKYKSNELAKKIAIVPQKFDIAFPFSVEEILEMGRYPHKKKFMTLKKNDYFKINQVIESVGLEDFLKKDITELSGGEEQRVIFGKALIQDTPILLLDESTSNLDPYHSHRLLSIVRKKVKSENILVIGVFHDFNLASLYCDNLLLLESGKVIKSGETKDILKSKELEEVFKIKWDVYEKEGQTFVIPKGER